MQGRDRHQRYLQGQVHVESAHQVPGPVITEILAIEIEPSVAVATDLLVDGQGELSKIRAVRDKSGLCGIIVIVRGSAAVVAVAHLAEIGRAAGNTDTQGLEHQFQILGFDFHPQRDVGPGIVAAVIIIEEEIDVAAQNIGHVDTQIHHHLHLGVPGDIGAAGDQLVDEIPSAAQISAENADDRAQVEGEAQVHVLFVEIVGKQLDPLDVDLDHGPFGIGGVQRKPEGLGIGKPEGVLDDLLHFLKH